MIEDDFKQLGLSGNEIIVYRSLVEIGKASTSLMAKRCGFARSSAYSALESLVQKGLVAVDQKSRGSFYTANHPSSLLRMLKDEKEEFENELIKRSEIAQQLIGKIEPHLKRTNYSVPRLLFFEGRENVRSMLYDRLGEWRANIQKYDNTWWGYQDESFVSEYRKFLDHAWSTAPTTEKTCLFSNLSLVEQRLRKEKISGREIKVLPNDHKFTSTIWAFGDYIVMIMTRQQPHYAFQIHDNVFAANQRAVFQLLWSSC